jgi:hypothetical protein
MPYAAYELRPETSGGTGEGARQTPRYPAMSRRTMARVPSYNRGSKGRGEGVGGETEAVGWARLRFVPVDDAVARVEAS